jgi:hypothetical protein
MMVQPRGERADAREGLVRVELGHRLGAMNRTFGYLPETRPRK